MEIIALSFAFGVITTILIILIIRVAEDDRDIENNSGDNGRELANPVYILVFSSSGNRDRRCNYRCPLSDEQKEKMLLVMQNLKRLTRGHERETVEEIIDYIEYEGMDI